MAELARDVGLAHSTAREWLGVLVASNQVFLLEPYHRSLGKRLVKSPKLYFTDTGLAAFLLGFPSARSLWASFTAGAFWENHVVGQWLRWRDQVQPSAGLWFWHDAAGAEVDLLVELGDHLVAIECKRTERPVADDARGIRKLRAFYGAAMVPRAYVACTSPVPFTLEDGVEARSGWTAPFEA
jgi:predicted AAA+ superfamily ATPase